VILLRTTLAIARRVLTELFRDNRARVLVLVAPAILMIFARNLFPTAAQYDRAGALLIGVFPAFSMCLSGSTALVNERSKGTLEAVLATPARRIALIAGYICAAVVASMAQAVVTITIAYTVCGLTTASPAWLMFVLAGLSAAFGMSLGVCVSAISKNEGEALEFVPGVLIPQLLLTGLVWPIPLMAGWTRRLADFLPLTALANTMTSARVHSFGGLSMLYSVAAMVAIIVTAIIVADITIGLRTVSD
jgi:ABC-2 type transport system permease protein